MKRSKRLLWKSAQHWLENWEDPALAKIYTDDCPLCGEYLNEDFWKMDCSECPVYKITGRHGCEGSPWALVIDARGTENFKQAAAIEYRFLVCLALGDKDEARKLCEPAASEQPSSD